MTNGRRGGAFAPQDTDRRRGRCRLAVSLGSFGPAGIAQYAGGQGRACFWRWLKIAEDGKVIVGIPQSELGQGVYTALAQIVAGELGADWRSVAVQPVPPVRILPTNCWPANGRGDLPSGNGSVWRRNGRSIVVNELARATCLW